MNQAALLDLLASLKARAYRFVTITPASHDRVLARSNRSVARCLEDALGWSLPFEHGLLDADILDPLQRAGALSEENGLLRSRIRVSSLGEDLFIHSAHPTEADNAVFFGPDSYRFATLIEAELSGCTGTLVDIGTGSGVGAVVGARCCPGARIIMTDINARALQFAAVNSAAAGLSAQCILGDNLDGIAGAIDVALANPPYIIDASSRAYRDGGGLLGAQVSLDMAQMAVERLAPGGKLILYTGSAIVDGRDALREALGKLG
ncbi:class I SAM-dependent methyltransferase, partial [Sphingomonas sp. MG17]